MIYEGRIAAVTGAGSGIGRALTRLLTQRGAHVAALDVDVNGLAETQQLCRPGAVTTYKVDVSDRESVLDHANRIESELGAASLVFNNAGVDLVALIADMSWEDFDWLMGVNVHGVVNGTKAFLPQLLRSGSRDRPSRVVNISSAFGLIAVPYQGAYSTSKFAVRGLTETLRQELIMEDQPVTAHTVHPGVIRTNFGLNSRTGDDPNLQNYVNAFDKVALTSADKTARIILRGVERNRARIVIGPDGYAAAALARVVGGRYSGALARASKFRMARQSVQAH